MTCPICDSPMDHGRCAECGFIHHDLEPLTGPFEVLAPGHLVREYATLEDAIAGGRALCSSYGIF
ncbi:MAG: hypothetical protein IJ592_02550, partial [Candidatus Methanomethylophilaceae archaeon]|nr:hypothetical protein [Candidatus Methanomethylophilaceae archaeon]